MLGSGVLLHVLFILYYLHPICETKILWPNVLDQSPFCLNLGQNASTGIKVENPSILATIPSLKKAVRSTWRDFPGDPVVKTSPSKPEDAGLIPGPQLRPDVAE